MSKTDFINFDNTYSELSDHFYQKVQPRVPSAPKLILANKDLADKLGLNFSSDDNVLKFLSGAEVPKGAEPIAQAYAGHQFGHFSPQLGDGRALLLGEILSPEGKRFDIQLKGSGPTAFSRRGDGLSALGPVLREYIVSEFMHRLDVPTTRALAAIETGDKVQREDEMPGGIFTRLASSHIRIGTFEYFAARRDVKALRELADYAINRHYSEFNDSKDKYFEFFKAVQNRQADLVSRWMSYGFIHGVMNTDNMTISGETIDYGPCAFMDEFKLEKVFSSIDHQGRYAYIQQPAIAQWNLSQLANCLIPLMGEDEEKSVERLTEEIGRFQSLFEPNWTRRMTQKLGLVETEEEDMRIVKLFINYLEENALDFTLSFRKLSELAEGDSDFYTRSPEFAEFDEAWSKRLKSQEISRDEAIRMMNARNPLFIARNHQIGRVIEAAVNGDYEPFYKLNQVLEKPFTEQPEYDEYAKAPEVSERVHATFCGT